MDVFGEELVQANVLVSNTFLVSECFDIKWAAGRNIVFAADVLKLLGVNVPRVSSTASWNYYNSPVFGNQQKPWLAENLYAYFSAGGDGKWREVNATDAVNKSNQGRVIVASVGIPPSGSDGHIAIVVPGDSGSNVRVAQAGLRNGKNLSVQEGFGGRTPRYFEYIGSR